ncbi:alpha/beta fold hydrolase [Microbispora sp. H10836]|uniref:alpha/beta fold hydrolase n=1 Tax=Microbispora sp. H10836 TaxID=2729106 RepID=UPI001472D8F9|nr:alpha/beta hydrolase [Microbispora sp. H10836]
MFAGFELSHVEVGDVRLRVRHGGRGPAVLLVHGHPRTHTTWNLVAVQRLALNHPHRVDHVVILGDVPIGEALARCEARFAQAWYHWFFMGQPAPLPERLIAADLDAWYTLDPSRMGRENHADVAAATADPRVRHAMCEDYRAGLGVDRAADDADRAAGRRITSPLLVLWGARDDLAELYDHDVLGVWRPWAADLSGHALDTGHHMMEEAPEALTEALLAFLPRP